MLIPFIDEDLMVSALAQLDHRSALSQEERARNILGREQTFWPAKAASGAGKGCVDDGWMVWLCVGICVCVCACVGLIHHHFIMDDSKPVGAQLHALHGDGKGSGDSKGKRGGGGGVGKGRGAPAKRMPEPQEFDD